MIKIPSRRAGVSLTAPALLAVLVSTSSTATRAADGPEVWFGDLMKVKPLDAVSLEVVPAIVKRALDGGDGKLEDLPGVLKTDKAPRAVFLSVSDGKSAVEVACGTGRGFSPALATAIETLRLRLDGRVPTHWLKMDVAIDGKPWVADAATAEAPFDRSLVGLAFGRSSGAAFTPEELVTRTLVSSAGKIMPRNITRYRLRQTRLRVEGQLPPLGSKDLVRFKTISFFHGDGVTRRLYRGAPPRPEISKEVLLTSCRAGADYLRRAVRENGSFVYSYYPKSDTQSERYNMVRHAGTIYSMLDIYETTRDPELLEAAERAIAYLEVFVKPFGEDDDGTRIMTYGGKIKLGGVALTAVALAEHALVTGRKEHLADAQGLCRYLRKNQEESGKFIHSRFYPTGTIGSHVSDYYPGEALLALLRTYAVDRDDGWLDTAEKGARYLIEVRDKGIETLKLTHDHWLLYALSELYRQRKKPLYLDHALRIAEAIEHKQRKSSEFPDWVGSYYTPPRSTPTACRCEGMAATYSLARDHGRTERAAAILANLRRNAGFQLTSQIGPSKAMYCLDPQRGLGGFTRSLTNFEVRIDYVQHNISALVALYRILDEEKREKL